MPILAQEPDLHPHDLFDQEEGYDAAGQVWWALYTRPRQEKQLMRRLRPLDVAFYSPLVPKRTRTRFGRIQTSHVPLFASYVFVHGDEAQRHLAVTTSCVSRWMPVPDGQQLFSDLREIRRLIEMGVPLTAEDRLPAGARIRIRSGPFFGFEGFITRREGQTRLLVAVNFLQSGASVVLDQCEVERIG